MISLGEIAAKVRRHDVLIRQLQSRTSVSSLLTLGVFGDGSDGNVNLDGSTDYPFATRVGTTYTLTRDIYSTALAIGPGVTVKPVGFRFFVRGTLTNNGTISAVGNDAAGSSAPSSNPKGNGAVVGVGPTGTQGSTSGGFAAQAGLGSFGGGTGGAGGAGTVAGGGVPSSGFTAATLGFLRGPFPGLIGRVGTTDMSDLGGGYGATGGGDATNRGGSSGNGGGMIVIYAQAVLNNGYFIVTGGKGGTPTAGNTGGGGGGGGGSVVAYTLKAWTAGSVDVSGGAGGGGFGTGTAGSAGAQGTSLNVVLA